MHDYYSIAKAALFKRYKFDDPTNEDIIQEVVIRLWEYDDGEIDGSFLAQRARYIVLDVLRMLGDKRRLQPLQINYVGSSQMVDDLSKQSYKQDFYEAKEDLERLSNWKFNYTETAIIEGFIDDKSMRDVAKELDTTEANVSQHVKKVKAKVKEIVYS
jgi:RNA polymerase sigma factor (sigma-70 family)